MRKQADLATLLCMDHFAGAVLLALIQMVHERKKRRIRFTLNILMKYCGITRKATISRALRVLHATGFIDKKVLTKRLSSGAVMNSISVKIRRIPILRCVSRTGKRFRSKTHLTGKRFRSKTLVLSYREERASPLPTPALAPLLQRESLNPPPEPERKMWTAEDFKRAHDERERKKLELTEDGIK